MRRNRTPLNLFYNILYILSNIILCEELSNGIF
nr:MAG TPA: hypothetical protein [Caudoviricetes sp.]